MRQYQLEQEPISAVDLTNDFRGIGLESGMRLMLHSALSSIGWVIGGAPTVIKVITDIIGETGTLVLPAATPLSADPSAWEEINIPAKWFRKVHENLPVFDKHTTPTTMGILPETFRNWPGTVRSNHPVSSVSARGNLAAEIVENHALEFSEGSGTPYEKVYDLDFQILLLGVGFNRCTMLHFAESRSPNKRVSKSSYPVMKNGKKEWIEVPDMGNDNSTHFPTVGELFTVSHKCNKGKIGNADGLLLSARELVDFGTEYFNKLNTK